MKTDDSDSVRHKVSLAVGRDIQQVIPAQRVRAKYLPGSSEQLPEFNSSLTNSDDAQEKESNLSDAPKREEDIADIHGLDSDEITPDVANVMETMMDEITRLRADLDIASNRIAFMEGLRDHDPIAGCLTAAAFVRQVALVLTLDEKGGTTSSLAMMTIKDWEAIHHGMNRKADETVISHVGRLLRDGARTGDVVGHTADDEFAIIFVASDLAETNELMGKMKLSITDNPPYWAHGSIEIETIWTSLSLSGFDNAEDVMARADIVMRQALKVKSS